MRDPRDEARYLAGIMAAREEVRRIGQVYDERFAACFEEIDKRLEGMATASIDRIARLPPEQSCFSG